MLTTKINFENANAKLKALATVLHRPLRDVLDSGARVAAISCARTSQPFGTGAEAKEAGEKAVARDIAKVYGTAGRAWANISSPIAAAVFWKAYKNGDFDVAERILQDFGGNGFSGVLFREFDDGNLHRAVRSKTTGRVERSPGGAPAVIVSDPENLKRYVEKKQKNVGFGKGGWADVARQISGNASRGLKQDGDISAAWISGKGRGFGRVFRSGSDEHPTIKIVSSIPYADRILQGGAKSDAIRIARERMIENLRIAVEYEAKRLR